MALEQIRVDENRLGRNIDPDQLYYQVSVIRTHFTAMKWVLITEIWYQYLI